MKKMGITLLAAAAACTFAVAPASAAPGGGASLSNPAHDCVAQATLTEGMGANTSGPYDANFNESASENGNGGGSAHGRPCAGSVGNADFKNPPGQLPGPEEDGNLNANPNSKWGGNVGYECDENQGIAKTNPAHTGCEGTSTSS